MAATVVLGWIMGFLTTVLPGRVSTAVISLVVRIAIDAAVGAFVMYANILDEDISDFRVALVPRSETNGDGGPVDMPSDTARGIAS